jgi:hypothetical protein
MAVAAPAHQLHRRQIFQSVYRDCIWGEPCGASPFFSGAGSRGEHAKSYLEAMAPLLAQHALETARELVIVDLGCGDFAIGSGLLACLGQTPIRYIGCDIVPELIDYNRLHFGGDHIEFHTADIVSGPLPDGDVCLIRQVFQHLSNSEITAVLPKLAKYRYVYVSNGTPLIVEGAANPDKPVGADVRFNASTGRGRGIDLDLPPWSLKIEEIARSYCSTGGTRESIVTHRILSFDCAGA